jgi:hypothetical protein
VRQWSRIQFSIGAGLGIFVNFLYLEVWALGLAAHLAKAAVVGLLCGIIAGRWGDAAWRWILGILRWSS